MSSGGLEEHGPDPATSPSGEAIKQRRAVFTGQAFGQLEPDEQELITWRYVDGLTCEEIGLRRGCSASYVSRICNEAIGRLRRSLHSSGPVTGPRLPKRASSRCHRGQQWMIRMNLARGAPTFPISGEDDSSFFLLLRQALVDHQDNVQAVEIDGPPATRRRGVQRIGRFEVIEVIGRGGYGTVLRVHDLKLGCERAMKVPNPETLASPRSLARFMDEARKAVLIDHPNVVRVVEADEIFPLYYMVMEYCPGGSLAGLAGESSGRPADCSSMGGRAGGGGCRWRA